MFDATAHLYDIVYSHKNYAAEAAWVVDAVRSRVPGARTLLDVACGTGAHLEHLREEFECQGLDLNARFVEIAGARTGLRVRQGDMDAFDLGESFDVVVCLFSAIGYSRDLPAAIASLARHVTPNGVVVVEPWFDPGEWTAGRIAVLDHEAGGTRVVRMTHSGRDGADAVLELHHLVGTASGIEHIVETHRITLFPMDAYEAAFRAAALSFELDRPGPFGRGALIGRPAA